MRRKIALEELAVAVWKDTRGLYVKPVKFTIKRNDMGL